MKSPGLHVSFFAVHRGICARALDHETQRGLRVPVRWRDLSLFDELQRTKQSMGGTARQARVVQNQNWSIASSAEMISAASISAGRMSPA